MELLPMGPVMIIDTPGIDDEGVLGNLRIQKAYQVLNKTDIALVIIDAAVGPSACLLYTSDAADDLLCEDLGGPRNIKKTKIK